MPRTQYGRTQQRNVGDSTAVRKYPLGRRWARSVEGVSRKVDVEQLVGAAEIAERLGVKRPQVVHDWRRRYSDFPEPVAVLKQAMVWAWPDVEKWARKTGRL